jgi:RNA polymerase sigma-70 factor (ECF subfamily)
MSSLEVAPTLASAMATDERACFDAFQKEFDYLCRTLRRLGVPAEDLEDEVHEVFLVLARRWREYDPSRPLRPYLFGIAFRQVSARRRKHWRERPSGFAELADSSLRPDEAVEAADVRALVLAALARVPYARRAVLVMHDIDEIPMRDITVTLSLPLFTGYSRLRKARQEFEAAVKALQKGTKEP